MFIQWLRLVRWFVVLQWGGEKQNNWMQTGTVVLFGLSPQAVSTCCCFLCYHGYSPLASWVSLLIMLAILSQMGSQVHSFGFWQKNKCLCNYPTESPAMTRCFFLFLQHCWSSMQMSGGVFPLCLLHNKKKSMKGEKNAAFLSQAIATHG